MSEPKFLPAVPLLRIAIALIIGIIAGDALASSVHPWWWAGGAAATLVLAIALRVSHPLGQSILLLLTTAMLGAVMTSNKLRQEGPVKYMGEREYEAIVMSEPAKRQNSTTYDMLLVRLDGKPLDHPFMMKVYVWEDTLHENRPYLTAGSGIKAFSSIRPPRASSDPDKRSYARYLLTHGVRAETSVSRILMEEAPPRTSEIGYFNRIRLKALRMRSKMLRNLKSTTISQDAYAIVSAMTLGNKTDLSRQQKEQFSISGASHILAISGLHLGIIYGVLVLLATRWRRFKMIAQMAIIMIIWGFVFLSGLSTGTIRAAIMLSIASLGSMGQRHATPINSLSLAALMVLCCNPLQIWDISFQLSFAAVLAILVYSEDILYIWSPKGRIGKMVWSWIIVSIAAQLGTAPLIAYHFGRFSCYFLLTNIVVIPITIIILISAMMLIVVWPMAWLQNAMVSGIEWLINLLNDVTHIVSSLPGASIENIHISTLQLSTLYLAIAFLTIPILSIIKRAKDERVTLD